ncbi:MAG: DUF975 family protein [Clostridia bacterium]|nr:DUF975 family protein [Clostridia bacterium]
MTAELKYRARAALQGHWLNALLIALIVNLPTLLVEAIASFTGNDLSARLLEIAGSVYSTGITQTASDSFRTQAAAMLTEPGIQWMLVLSLIAKLLTPALALSMCAWMIGRLRGREDEGPAAGAFCRIRYIVKAICQKILMVLKVILWMLPGTLLCAGGMVLLTQTAAGTSDFLKKIAELTVWLGYGLMAVLGIRAALHYSLADMVLADAPQTGALASIRMSTAYMRNRKMQLFLLGLSFIGWNIAVMLVSSFVGNTAGNVAYLVVQMFGSLALSVYMNTSVAAFYDDCRTADHSAGEAESKENGREDESL